MMIVAILLMFLSLSSLAPWAQTVSAQDRPLPDISTLMHDVEAHQKAAEAIEKDYLYHASDTLDQLDSHGSVRKTETREYDIFWIEDVRVYKLTGKDGRDLSPKEQKKQNEDIDKQVAKAKKRRAKAESQGKPVDPDGNDEVTVSRLLELGRFTNPRRVSLMGEAQS